MAKKTFKMKGGFDSLLESHQRVTEEDVAPKEINNLDSETTQDMARLTFRLEAKLFDQIKDIAYWSRLQLSEVLREALQKHVKQYIQENGTLESRLNKKK